MNGQQTAPVDGQEVLDRAIVSLADVTTILERIDGGVIQPEVWLWLR